MRARIVLFLVAVTGLCAAWPSPAADAPKKRAASHSRLAAESRPEGGLTAPLVGFAAIQAGETVELRPIEGVPGASVFGLPVALPEGVQRIHLAPGNAFALLEMAQEPRIIALHLKPEGGAICQPLPEAVPAPSAVAFSPGGVMAALLSEDRQRVQVFDPRSGEGAVRDSAFPSSLTEIAVSDLGEVLALDPTGVIWSAAPDGTQLTIHRVNGAAALAFVPDSGQAVLWDSDGQSLYWLERGDGGWSSRLAADGPDGIAGAVRLRVLSGGRAALLAASESRQLWRIGLAEPSIEMLELPLEPLALDGLRLPGAFLLGTGSAGEGWLLSGAGSQPQVVFVPAVRSEGEQQ